MSAYRSNVIKAFGAVLMLLINIYVITPAVAANDLQSDCLIGSSSSCPAQSPQEIINLYGTTANGSYWLNVNGTARETYLILSNAYPDSGGWFLGMKGTKTGGSFWYSSSQWTDQTTTLNTNSLTDDVSTESKFDAFNYLPVTKLVAVFKDRDSHAFNASGSGDLGTNSFAGHTWMETVTSTTMFSRFTTNSNIVDGAGYTGRYTIHRETNASNGKLVFPYQTGWTRYGFANSLGKNYRWGVTSNNEGSMGSNDSVSGIGLDANSASAIVTYSDNLTVGPNGSSGATNPGTLNYPSGFQIWGKMANPSIAAPVSLTRTNISPGTVKLNIGAVAAATEYAVQYKLSSTSGWSNATTLRLTSPDASTPSATISGLSSGTYDFRVWSRATNNSSATATSLNNEVIQVTSTFNSLTLSDSASYRKAVTITANVSVASRVTFRAKNVIIPGCKNKLTSGTSPNIIATCTWRPSVRGNIPITATSTPISAGTSGATANPVTVVVGGRSGPR